MLLECLDNLTIILSFHTTYNGNDLVHLLGQHAEPRSDRRGKHLRGHWSLPNLRLGRLGLDIAVAQTPLDGTHSINVLLPVLSAEHAPMDDAEGGVPVGGGAEGFEEGRADVVVLVDFGPQYDLESHVGFAGVVVGVYVSLLHGEEEALGDLPAGCVVRDHARKGVESLRQQQFLDIRFESVQVGDALGLQDHHDTRRSGGLHGILFGKRSILQFPIVIVALALLPRVIPRIILDELVMLVLVLQRRVLKRVHPILLHVPIINLRMKKVMSITPHGPILIAQYGIIRHVHKHTVVEQLTHLSIVQFILDEDPLGLHQERKGLEDVEVVRHADGHGSLGKVHHDQVEGAEPFAGDEGETFGGVAEPPLDAGVFEVGLGVEML
mmetsp:Transcript_6244/g.11177  ORF Transcript_6244/g.11177 Transcript_6244/m.11177 type:complete len:381 (+) Transcript_6244:1190-2332(+)